MTQTKEQREGYIKALLEERRGYVMRSDDAGVAEVDAELARIGAEGKPAAKRAQKRTAE